jgi:endonuclease/exonuclease/phosphatase family metal-dependent hydrolase
VPGSPDPDAPTLRVMAWNLRGLRAGAATVAAVMEEEAPDLALLNEVGRTGWRLRGLVRRAGMDAVTDVRLLRRGITNAVLVRPPWRVVEHVTVPFSHRPGTIPRGMVTAVVGRSGYRLTAAAVHLGLSDPERADHARELTDLLPSLRHPVILGGDLNEPPEGGAATWISERLWDAYAQGGEGPGETYPAGVPTARIDYVFVSEGVRVDRAWVRRDPGEEASDHLPVLAELALTAS